MVKPLELLGNLPVKDFLRDYWQKKPALIRQAIPDFESPISADEMAGLSLEEQVESRIVIENGETPWQLLKGPFEEDIYQKLPASNWTLLIQAADQLIPEVTDLLEQFRFIPSWRLDDIMISYAARGGSVGPHYDQYDVFLLQAGGQRHWQVGPKYSHRDECLDQTQLHILKSFETTEEYTLNPGDMLYLPPQFGHWGKALDDECITYSIGFRAPSKAEILEELLQECLMELSEEDRFSDPDLALQDNAGQISANALQKIQAMWTKALTPDAINQWFGRYMTQTKYPQDDIDCEGFESLSWDDSQQFERNPASRYAFIDSTEGTMLFVDGEALDASATLAQTLCDHREFSGKELSSLCKTKEDKATLQLLISAGKLEAIEFD